MEYQLLGKTSNQPYKFRTRNWVETNDDRRGTYDKKSLKFKTAMVNGLLCD